MRCPKCHYLSFEPESRCRNCGYDFSLSSELSGKEPTESDPSPLDNAEIRPEPRVPAAPVTLGPIRLERVEAPAAQPVRPPRPARPDGPIGEAMPAASIGPSAAGSSAPSGVAVAERVITGPRRREPVRRPSPAPIAASTSELPLFVRGLHSAPIETPTELARESKEKEEDPVVAVPPAPPPLSVRRSTPDPAQLRQKYQAPDAGPRKAPVSDLIRPIERRTDVEPLDRAAGADRDLLQMLDRPEPVQPPAPAPAPEIVPVTPAAARLIAAMVDGLLLSGINAGVMWFTLRMCGLQLANAGSLPLVPLFAFLLLVDAGYLLLFTAASGQTVGKMAAGIRVVPGGPDPDGAGRLTFSQAALRTALSFPSVLALGAGFVPGLLGEGRALHDRVADTRVVRA